MQIKNPMKLNQILTRLKTKVLIISLMILMTTGSGFVNAQTTEPAQNADDLATCKKKLDLAVKSGNQTLDELVACEDLANTRLNELKKVEKKSELQENKITELEGLIVNLKERIAELEKIKCSEFTLIKLFWVIKIGQFKKCS